jgi:hypothetical protein
VDVVGSVEQTDVPSKPDACGESLGEFTGHVYKAGSSADLPPPLHVPQHGRLPGVLPRSDTRFRDADYGAFAGSHASVGPAEHTVVSADSLPTGFGWWCTPVSGDNGDRSSTEDEQTRQTSNVFVVVDPKHNSGNVVESGHRASWRELIELGLRGHAARRHRSGWRQHDSDSDQREARRELSQV